MDKNLAEIKTTRKEQTNIHSINESEETCTSRILTIIYQKFPDADWATIKVHYQNRDELFLDALEGAYQLKHQDGIDSIKEYKTMLNGNREAIFNQIKGKKS